MKIIDANTGHEVKIGRPFHNVVGKVTVKQVDEGWLSARALVQVDDEKDRWVPLIVRYTHPGFMFQKVAFLPS